MLFGTRSLLLGFKIDLFAGCERGWKLELRDEQTVKAERIGVAYDVRASSYDSGRPALHPVLPTLSTLPPFTHGDHCNQHE